MDKLDFLDGAEAPVEDVRAAEPEAPEAAETPQEQPQEPVVTNVTPPAEQLPKPEPIMVPLAALHEVRDELKTVKAALSQYQQPPQPEPVETPDFIDPEGTAFIQQQLDSRLWQQTLRVSERFAKKEYGEAAVDEAFKWAFDRCNTDPIFNAKIRSSDDPYGVAVQEYRREKIATEVTDADFEQFKAWKAAQAQLTQTQPAAPAAPEQPPIPSPSIASATSAGGVQHVAVGPGVAFGDAIK